MKLRHTLVFLAIAVTLINTSITLGANEMYRNVYSGFGIEDPDPDMDGVKGKNDKCPGTSFDLFVITKSTSKQKVVLPFGTAYLRLNKITTAKKNAAASIVLETAVTDAFNKSELKKYTIEPGKVTAIEAIGKRVRVLYSHAKKEIALVWIAPLESATPGCSVEESYRTGEIEDQS